MPPPTFSDKIAHINLRWIETWVEQGRRNVATEARLIEAEKQIAQLRRDLDALTHALYDAAKRTETE